MSVPHTRRRTAFVVAAALALPLVAAVATSPALAGPPPSALAEPPSVALLPGGGTVENSFVSAVGWVKPGESYPSRIILKTVTGAGNASVVVNGVPGMSFQNASTGGVGTAVVTPSTVTWTIGPLAPNSTSTLVLQSAAATTAADPEVVWKNISSNAVVTFNDTVVNIRSHGPKVIPLGTQYNTARYGDRPFPVVPVEYTDRKFNGVTTSNPLGNGTTNTAEGLDKTINDPATPGSTYNLFQEMSLGQLFPKGSLPSVGIATAGFPAGLKPFTTLNVQGTCTGATFSNDTAVRGTPAYPERIKDGKYQLPGQTEYYGRDKFGSGVVGAVAGVGAIFDIDGGCGPTAKSVYDAAVIADPEIDYSDFDTDKDGVVDFFMMVYAGCGGNGASQLSPLLCDDATSYDNIWPHSSSLEFTYVDPATGQTGYISSDQLKDLEGRPLWYVDESRSTKTVENRGDALKVFVRVGPYNVNPETAIDKASVISHEYGHSLGLPDFYSLGSRETYGDLNLMATDKSHHMDIFSRQEMGWVVPRVLGANSTRTASDWRDSKLDIESIDWVRPDGTPYTLATSSGDQGIHNAEAYVAKLPGRQVLDPAALTAANGSKVYHSGVGNDFGCVPNGGRNLDIALPELKNFAAGTSVKVTFDSRWDIEWDFDYGFVMTAKKQGNAVVYTSKPSAKGYTTPNTTQGNPAGNPNANQCQGTYGNGITGSSGSYQDGTQAVDRVAGNYPSAPFIADEYDISDLVGQEGAALRFSYATDPGLARQAWFIDNITITATPPGGQPTTIYTTDLETTGDPEDDRIYNGGCKDTLTTASVCTGGWAYLTAGAENAADHAYYLEMRDRSGFDNTGRGESDRGAPAFEPGLLLTYTDESHGYGNVGTDNPPAQSPLDSTPTPGSDTPNLNDATFTAADARKHFDDNAADPHFDNYTDPARVRDPNAPKTDETESPWVFDYSCLGFDVTRMAGTAGSELLPFETGADVLSGDVTFTMGSGCGAFDYGFDAGGNDPDAPGPVIPEVPLPAVLPLAAVVIGAAVYARRRRAGMTA